MAASTLVRPSAGLRWPAWRQSWQIRQDITITAPSPFASGQNSSPQMMQGRGARVIRKKRARFLSIIGPATT